MEHVLAQQGLRLTYLCDPRAIDDIDQDRVLDDLSDDTADGDLLSFLTRYRLADYHHLVLVTDCASGSHLALLAATDGATPQEEFLLLETAFVARPARGQNLVRRMIAHTLLRMSSTAAVPHVIAACTRSPICHQIMRETARRFAGAVLFPDLHSPAIDFRAATLARRIARAIRPGQPFLAATGVIGPARNGNIRDVLSPSHSQQIDSLLGAHLRPADRMLAVIDMRAASEASILEDALRIYRSK